MCCSKYDLSKINFSFEVSLTSTCGSGLREEEKILE